MGAGRMAFYTAVATDKKHIISLGVAALFCMLTASAQACMFAQRTAPVAERMEASKYAFIARIIAEPSDTEMVLDVLHTYKGDVPQQIKAVTNQDSCGFFQPVGTVFFLMTDKPLSPLPIHDYSDYRTYENLEDAKQEIAKKLRTARNK